MQIHPLDLLPGAPGVHHSLQVLRFRTPGAGPKACVQAAQAAELGALLGATVELRGQADTSHELAERDAGALVRFLTLRGVKARMAQVTGCPSCFYARNGGRWAMPGKRLGKVAGTSLARTGKLLSP